MSKRERNYPMMAVGLFGTFLKALVFKSTKAVDALIESLKDEKKADFSGIFLVRLDKLAQDRILLLLTKDVEVIVQNLTAITVLMGIYPGATKNDQKRIEKALQSLKNSGISELDEELKFALDSFDVS